MPPSQELLCVPTTFSPSVFGAEVLEISTVVVKDYNAFVPGPFRFAAPAVNLTDGFFCNVTVTYTHPGQGDAINVEAWLPIDDWNGRLQAVGGGGWVAGRSELAYPSMTGAIADGFATITTDAGVNTIGDPNEWTLKSPGNVDWSNLLNFGYISLNDQALFGKAIVKDFYGKSPDYSYWIGCSQGGRQGLAMAQRYPTAYDGIIAAAPAVYLDQQVLGLQWPQQIMNELGEFPPACELQAISEAVFRACDGLDGVVDGVISHPDECLTSFDPLTTVGKCIKCAERNGTTTRISKAAAVVASLAWKGVVDQEGKQYWPGVSPGADLTGTGPRAESVPGTAMTRCNATACEGAPALGFQFIETLLFKGDPSKDLKKLSRSAYLDLLHDSIQQYDSILGTGDTDLSRFRKAGGKIMSYHGTSDQLLPVKATENYYNEVIKADPDARAFFRHYVVPGLGHCFGGQSTQPEHMFAQLRDWVEKGKVPEESPVQVHALNGQEHDRIVCPYPEIARFDKSCGNVAAATCWRCEGGR